MLIEDFDAGCVCHVRHHFASPLKGYSAVTITTKMLLVLQVNTQDLHTWSVESRNFAAYRMFRMKVKGHAHKGHWSKTFTGHKPSTMFVASYVVGRDRKRSMTCIGSTQRLGKGHKRSILTYLYGYRTSLPESQPTPMPKYTLLQC